MPKPLSMLLFLKKLKRFAFLFFILSSSTLVAQSNFDQRASYEDYIHSLVNKVQQECRVSNRLSEDSFSRLPIGITPSGCSGTSIVVIDSAYRGENGRWYFTVYASVVLPGSTEPIAFAGKNFSLDGGGISSAKEPLLFLVSEKSISLGNLGTLRIPADGNNNVTFSCDGFKSIKISADLVFNTTLIESADDSRPQEVISRISFSTSNLNDIVYSFSISPFRIRGIDNVSFQVQEAAGDFSDYSNPTGFSAPKEVYQEFGKDLNLWRGVFFKNVTIRIHSIFGDSTRSYPTISARDFLIDDRGVSGTFVATHIMSLQNGQVDGWPISFDKIELRFIFNDLAGGELSGLLKIPILGDNPIPYKALAEKDAEGIAFKVSISTTKDISFDSKLGATIVVRKGSEVGIGRSNGKVFLFSNLNGELSFSQGLLHVDGVTFQDFQVTSRKPYVVGGIFSTIPRQDKHSQFPVGISKLTVKVAPGLAGLSADVYLNLGEDMFRADGTFNLIAELERANDSSTQRWKVNKYGVDSLALQGSSDAISLGGFVKLFKEDSTYGDGFRGQLRFLLGDLMDKSVLVNAVFGRTDGFKYWHMDASFPVKTLKFGAVTFVGFKIAASHRMARVNWSNDPGNGLLMPHLAVYKPDKNSGVSVAIGATLFIKKEKLCNADVDIEVAFTNRKGFKHVMLSGDAFLLTTIEEREKSGEAPIYGRLMVLFDLQNKVFHVNVIAHMNLAGIVRGAGPNDKVGELVIHVDPRDWYFYVGRPSEMAGINILGLFKAKFYFMVGTQVEPIPDPPDQLREVFGEIDISMMRDERMLRNGNGLAFGLNSKFKFDERLGPFYAVLKSGGGIDFMVKEYRHAECLGRPGRKIGLNGWYGGGQFYLYFMGKIGIRFKGSDFDIVNIASASLFQANFFNPSWLRGVLAGRFSILGGLVKGKFRLRLEIGDKCEVVVQGGEVTGVRVIADMKPRADSVVSVFTAPQVSFNTSINTQFSMMDHQDRISSYRVKIHSFNMSNKKQDIATSIRFNESMDVASLKTEDVLPANSELKLHCSIFWEKNLDNSGWRPVTIDGKLYLESDSTVFTTGGLPDFIPAENVVYSYPTDRQYHLHLGEERTGYIQLDFGQDYLFEENKTDPFVYVVEFLERGVPVASEPIRYDVTQNRISFVIPEVLEKEKVFNMRLLLRVVGQKVDENVSRNEKMLTSTDDEEIYGNENLLNGSILESREKKIYELHFRTSKFDRFLEKFNSLTGKRDIFDVAVGNVTVIGQRITTSEGFDEVELKDTGDRRQAFVRLEADGGNKWFKDYISRFLYDAYPIDDDVKIEWRDVRILGLKPLKAVSLRNESGAIFLTDNEITRGFSRNSGTGVILGYYVPFYAFRDFIELRNKAASRFIDNWNDAGAGAKDLLRYSSFTDILEGNYKVLVKYFLPGGTSPKFEGQFIIKY